MSGVMKARMLVPVLAAPGATSLRTGVAADVVTQQPGNVILRMAKQWRDPDKDPGGTIWRYFETWQTDVVRLDSGELLRVEPYVYRKKTKGDFRNKTGEILPASKVVGSVFPPAGWQKTNFDDSGWTRQPGSFEGHYRSLALICVRGKFEMRDPAQVAGWAIRYADDGLDGSRVANCHQCADHHILAGAVGP
jgi:hypothetical protein